MSTISSNLSTLILHAPYENRPEYIPFDYSKVKEEKPYWGDRLRAKGYLSIDEFDANSVNYKNSYFAKDIKFKDNINDVMQSIVPRGSIATATYTSDLLNTFSKAIDSDNSFMVRNEDKDIKDKRGGVDYIRKDVAQSELYKNFEPIELGVEASKRFAVDKASSFDRFMSFASELASNVDEKTLNSKEFQKDMQEDIKIMYEDLEQFFKKTEAHLAKYGLPPDPTFNNSKDRREYWDKRLTESTKSNIGASALTFLGNIKTKEELNEVIEKAKKIIKELPKVEIEKYSISKESRKAQLNFLEQLQLKLKDTDVFEPFKTVRELSNAVISDNKITGKLYG
jgi:glycogen debranching enzyme